MEVVFLTIFKAVIFKIARNPHGWTFILSTFSEQLSMLHYSILLIL